MIFKIVNMLSKIPAFLWTSKYKRNAGSWHCTGTGISFINEFRSILSLHNGYASFLKITFLTFASALSRILPRIQQQITSPAPTVSM